jgi:Tol biopolymer transport system component
MRIQKSLFILVLILLAESMSAQYFGRNKPRYHEFDFEVLNTPNFSIHHYLNNRERLMEVAQWCEDWYALHQAVLQDTIEQRNPFILYSDHGDFQQTNAINSSIGASTGGVTEGFKNRVILPFAFTSQQTHHVIGHELVHAFQYNMILRGDSTNYESLANLPLWMIEGLAEYLSIGRFDSHTAMWMRDAVLSDDIPSLKELNSYEYFPYRWGQAFWSFITGMYGDEVIEPLFVNTARYGLNITLDSMFKVRPDTLSNLWVRTLKKYYKPILGERAAFVPGKKILDEKNAGRMNLSPSVSPNGRYVIFLSEKDLFTTDLFLADTRTGKIIQKVGSTIKDGHLDELSYLESSGSWSRNSKEFVYVAYKHGRNWLVIKDAEKGKIIEEIKIPGIRAIANPNWSPKSDILVFSGMVEGQTDLYTYNLKTKEVSQLTNDRYSEIQPNWSPDGEEVIFATDERSMNNGRSNGKWTFNPAILNVKSGEVEQIEVFSGADNLNPVFDHEGHVLFLSDRDGFRNIYRYRRDSNKVYQMTDILTGVSGISKFSPAISVARKRDKVIYTHYTDKKYVIHDSKIGDMMNKEVDAQDVDMKAAILPFINAKVSDIVNENMQKLDHITTSDTSLFKDEKYKPKFKLDHVFGSGIGVGVGTGSLGTQTGLAGGVNLIFSDMLGNNQLYTAATLNGEILDFGGLISYLNRKNRIAWGINLSHLPFRTGAFSVGTGTVSINGIEREAIIEQTDILRIYEEQLSVFGQYPLSKIQRFEAGVGINYRFFRRDLYRDYYDITSGFFIGSEREKIETEDVVYLSGYAIRKDIFYSLNAAWVGDNSFFGIASPLSGYRWRVAIDKYFGGYSITSTNLDARYYHRIKPVTLALRFQHYAQFSSDPLETFPILIGSGQWGLIRGFDYSHLDENFSRYDLNFDQLSGSKFAVGGFEVRLPFTGPERLALIKSRFIFSDLNLFLDAGIAFDDYEELSLQPGDPNYASKGELVASYGVSVRINLFGALILEPYYAWAMRKGSRPVFGLNIVPGW